MSNLKQAKDFNIGREIYNEIYNSIIEAEVEEKDEYKVDDFADFMLYNGNHEDSFSLLCEADDYYIDEVAKEWDDIIELISNNTDLFDFIKPRQMTQRKITELFLYMVCDEVIDDYVEELNNKKNEE